MKKRLLYHLWIGIVAVGFVFLSATASMALVMQSFEGTVDIIDDGGLGNPFGLAVGDTIFLDVTFDPTVPPPISVDPSGDMLYVDDYAGWDFTITLGSFVFSQSDLDPLDQLDSAFWFFDGDFDGIEFYHMADINTFPGVVIEHFNAAQWLFAEWDNGNYFMEAEWDFTPITPVPEPGSMAMIAAGLLGLVAWRRKHS